MIEKECQNKKVILLIENYNYFLEWDINKIINILNNINDSNGILKIRKFDFSLKTLRITN